MSMVVKVWFYFGYEAAMAAKKTSLGLEIAASKENKWKIITNWKR